MKTYFPIRGFEDAPDRFCVGWEVPPLNAQNCCVGAANQFPHAGEAELFACSPVFQLHAHFVRQAHIDVNAAVTAGEHG